MPKVIISKNNFFEQDIYTQKFNVRFRIISDNQNNFSYWSPIFQVDPQFIFIPGNLDTSGSLLMEKHTGYVANIWDSVSICKEVNSVNTLIDQLSEYDFWIQYTEDNEENPSDWIYKERINTTSFNQNIPETYTDATGVSGRVPTLLKVEVYRPGRPILRYSDNNISITQNSTSVGLATDTIVTASAHSLTTGDTIVYTSSSAIGGLVTDTAYWIRVVNPTTFNIYNNRLDAINDVNKINLTSTGSGTGNFDRYPFLLYKNKINDL